MKKLLLALVALVSITAASAQQRQLELSVFSGKTRYQKIDSPYYREFNSGWGVGFQAKYYLTNNVYWTSDLYFDTDDDTHIREEGRFLSLYRREYGLTTGFGADLFKSHNLKLYLQAQGGFGAVEGHYSTYSQLFDGIERSPLDRKSYLVGGTIGCDYRLSRSWSIGAGYRFHYLGDFDGTHTLFGRISFILP